MVGKKKRGMYMIPYINEVKNNLYKRRSYENVLKKEKIVESNIKEEMNKMDLQEKNFLSLYKRKKEL